MKRALVIGGSRFFGRHLVRRLLEKQVEVALLTRGKTDDGFGDQVQRLIADRTSAEQLRQAVSGKNWDFVFDQVCFTAEQARAACEIFEGKIGRYIFTSTQSVYKMGAALSEAAFDPLKHSFSKEDETSADYGEAKRQAEAIFATRAKFPVLMARFPIVLGTDDYTRRLHWHIEHVKSETPMFFPNLNARMGFVRSDQAGEALADLGVGQATGPVNIAADGALAMGELIGMIEKIVGKKAVFADSPTEKNHSPFGVPEDWFMEMSRLKSLGIRLPMLADWLEPLIRNLL